MNVNSFMPAMLMGLIISFGFVVGCEDSNPVGDMGDHVEELGDDIQESANDARRGIEDATD